MSSNSKYQDLTISANFSVFRPSRALYYMPSFAHLFDVSETHAQQERKVDV